MAEVDPRLHYILSVNRGVRDELREVRDRVYDGAGAVLAGHRDDGKVKLTKTSGRVDQYVNLVDGDTGKGEPAAAAIEFGHTTPNGTAVEGIHALRRGLSAA